MNWSFFASSTTCNFLWQFGQSAAVLLNSSAPPLLNQMIWWDSKYGAPSLSLNRAGVLHKRQTPFASALDASAICWSLSYSSGCTFLWLILGYLLRATLTSSYGVFFFLPSFNADFLLYSSFFLNWSKEIPISWKHPYPTLIFIFNLLKFWIWFVT